MKQITDEDIEKYCISLAMDKWTIARCIDVAKWLRDQQPKLKTLEEWGWIEEEDGVVLVCQTPLGAYRVTMWGVDGPGYKQSCHSKQHGKQLAQADYEKRVNDLYEK